MMDALTQAKDRFVSELRTAGLMHPHAGHERLIDDLLNEFQAAVTKATVEELAMDARMKGEAAIASEAKAALAEITDNENHEQTADAAKATTDVADAAEIAEGDELLDSHADEVVDAENSHGQDEAAAESEGTVERTE